MLLVETILSLILITVLVSSLIIVIKKRKNTGITGIKSALTHICFFLISIFSLLAYWLKYTGLTVWLINVFLLIMAAFFTKYMPKGKNGTGVFKDNDLIRG
ncbi:hypothetical protein [Niallia circulans]|uniref:hypothetical protein n=1 Tax=Niallia circulans TaxID=1397 RepID=UPI001F1B6596|nr:hypothetical protein [Niallia circulans]